MVQPGDFLPVAEDTGLIVPMGLQVLQIACAQIKQWAGAFPDGSSPWVSVNLSAGQLGQVELVDDVARILAESGASPASLCIEITENLLMQDTPTTIDTLKRLRDLGVELAIDDFGTGYSSLSYLRRLPVTVLKIDQSFVLELGLDPQGATIVASVIDLAHALGMECVAEGVENDVHLATLARLGCDEMQGFLFSPRFPPTDATALHRPRLRHPDIRGSTAPITISRQESHSGAWSSRYRLTPRQRSSISHGTSSPERIRTSETCWCATIRSVRSGASVADGNESVAETSSGQIGTADTGQLGRELEQVGSARQRRERPREIEREVVAVVGFLVVGQADDGILEAEQDARIDDEREVEIDRAFAALFGMEIDLPGLAERVRLDEMALVVHVEPVLDRVILQIGNESRNVDDGHRVRGYRTPRRSAAPTSATRLVAGFEQPRRDRRTRGSCRRNA